VSPAALTLRGYAEAVAAWYDREPVLAFRPWDDWRRTVSPESADLTWDHIAHSPNASIAKATRLLDYRPRYSSLAAVREALDWLAAEGAVPPLR
jgi:nucleoside-diphosphate-sugar epimerase